MPSNTSASMFGGAGGRGSKVSVSSLQGLRNVLRNETEKDSPPVAQRRPSAAAPPAPSAASPAAPVDDKQTLRGLNDRLSGYLSRVKQLEKENADLEGEIDEIVAERKAPEGRDWDEIERPLEELKKQINDITMDNAKLLLQIDNAKLAEDDFKKKLKEETKARKELEKDVDDLKKTIDETQLNCKQTQKEIDLAKKELACLDLEHKDEVDVLREKIKDSEVKVEIDSQNSNLAEILNKIRKQYDKLAKKNLRETEEWYQSKFENIKVEEAQKNEVLLSGKMELKELVKEKQSVDVKIQSLQAMIRNLEGTIMSIRMEYSQRQAPLNQVILDLEEELRKVRSQVERHVETNKNLLCVKMKLEAEINNYQQLIQGMTADTDSLELAIEDALHKDQQKPDNEVPEQKTEDEAILKQDKTPSFNSPPPKAPGDATAQLADMLLGDPIEAEKTDVLKAQTKSKKEDSSSSSSSSSSESEDEKPANKVKAAKA